MSTRRSGQVWSLDFIFAVTVFVVVIFLFLRFQTNITSLNGKNSENMITEAESLSGNLITSGNPSNWTSNDVNMVGITDGNFRIDERKVQQFYYLSRDNYTYSKRILSVSNDYTVQFADKDGIQIPVDGVLSIGKNLTFGTQKNVIKVDRFLIYNSVPIKMVVYIW